MSKSIIKEEKGMPASATEVERRIYEVEGIRVVFRCPSDELLKAYSFERMAAGRMTVSEWTAGRLQTRFNEDQWFDIVIINGQGALVHGRTLLNNLRNSYDKAKDDQ